MRHYELSDETKELAKQIYVQYLGTLYHNYRIAELAEKAIQAAMALTEKFEEPS